MHLQKGEKLNSRMVSRMVSVLQNRLRGGVIRLFINFFHLAMNKLQKRKLLEITRAAHRSYLGGGGERWWWWWFQTTGQMNITQWLFRPRRRLNTQTGCSWTVWLSFQNDVLSIVGQNVLCCRARNNTHSLHQRIHLAALKIPHSGQFPETRNSFLFLHV